MLRSPPLTAGARPADRLALVPLLLVCLVAACGHAGQPPRRAVVTGTQGNAITSTRSTGTVYVALGASDAFGIGTGDPDRQNWPTILAGKLGAHVHLIDLGIPGATVAQAQRDELPVALGEHPDIVTIWLGVNDLVARVDRAAYADQLRSLLQALRERASARIFVGNLPDLSLVPYFQGQDLVALRAQVKAWNAAIAGACAAEGARLVDLAAAWSQFADHPEYISSDGLHPSTAGAIRIADTFAAAIKPAGAP